MTEDGEKRPAGGRSAVDAAAAHYRRDRAGGMAKLPCGEACLRSHADRRTHSAAKGEGDSVHAGTPPSGDGVPFRASAVGSHTAVTHYSRMGTPAQSSKPEISGLPIKSPRYSVSSSCTALRFRSAPLSGISSTGAANCLYAGRIATTVPIIARPCALAPATLPMSIISGVVGSRRREFGVRWYATPMPCNAPVR